MFVSPLYDQTRLVLFQMAPGIPYGMQWVTVVVILILAATALVDAFREIVPDVLICLGLSVVIAVIGFFGTWEESARHLLEAIAAGCVIWAINFAWFLKFRYDALGMGDAKWTMLAVACFGFGPSLLAWGIGSVLATIFIGSFRFFKGRLSQVSFAPFLFVGLGVGVYIVRFWYAMGGAE